MKIPKKLSWHTIKNGPDNQKQHQSLFKFTPTYYLVPMQDDVEDIIYFQADTFEQNLYMERTLGDDEVDGNKCFGHYLVCWIT